MANRPMFGYPTSFGNVRASLFPHKGPTAYAVLVYGPPVTGGDQVQATEGGLKILDMVHPALTDSGNFEVQPIPSQPSTNPGSSSVSWTLKWEAQRTATIGGQAQTAGTEAVVGTNLTGEVVRFSVLGK